MRENSISVETPIAKPTSTLPSESSDTERVEGTNPSSTPIRTSGSNSLQFRSTDRILLLGDSGSGKTNLAETIAAAYRRVIVISADPEEFRTHPNRINTIDPERTRAAISEGYAKGNVLVVVDDTDNFFTRYENDNRIRGFLILSRHRNTGWIIICRRPTDLPPLVFTQANKICAFQTNHPRELGLYEDYIGGGASGIIRGLNRREHEFLYFDREEQQIRKLKVGKFDRAKRVSNPVEQPAGTDRKGSPGQGPKV